MTTLGSLVAGLFLYLFVVSSLSLCSLDGKHEGETQGGRAIGSSHHSNVQEDADLSHSKAGRQDGKETSQTHPTDSLKYEKDTDSLKDGPGDSVGGVLESHEKVDESHLHGDKERNEESSFANAGSTSDSDRIPVFTNSQDTERSSKVKLNEHQAGPSDSEGSSSKATREGHSDAEQNQDDKGRSTTASDISAQSSKDSVRPSPEQEEKLHIYSSHDSNWNGTTTDESDEGRELKSSKKESEQEDVKEVVGGKEVGNDEREAILSQSDTEKGKLQDGDEKGKETVDPKGDIEQKEREKISEDEEKHKIKNEIDRADLETENEEVKIERGKAQIKEESAVNETEDEKETRKEEEEEETKDERNKETKELDSEIKVEKERETGKGQETKEDKDKEVKEEKPAQTIEKKDERTKEENDTETKDEDVKIEEPQKEEVKEETKPEVKTDKDVEERQHLLEPDDTGKEVKPNITDHDVIKTEEMPSYGEWREKKLQQAQEDFDRELGQGERNPVPAPKFNLNENSKNHASADCGAKILGTNPEAQNALAILNSNRDIYMINPCSAKTIWFTVELCEPIQVKLIELANYELFSCVPESFKVSISDRYPVREWHLLGTFVARDERSLQNFPLNEETMFAKYMKIEMLTFFGSEHFCPLSVLRVFGTSMVEEIDDADGVNADTATEQDVLPVHPTPLPEDMKGNGILENAKDAVFKFVEKAAKVLTGSKPDEAATTDNIAEDAAEEMVMERDHQDGRREDDKPEDGGSESFNETHNDKCNGQDVCFQENYSTISQHCCLSLFAQTAGSILICCKALKKGPKPIKTDEETGEESNKLPIPTQLPMEVIETKMDFTQAATEGSIQTSVVIEPTPLEGHHREDKIETSAPPLLTVPTKTSTHAARRTETPPTDILATHTEMEQILKTPIEQTMNMVDDAIVRTDGTSKDWKESQSDVVSVAPIPPPPTIDAIKGDGSKVTSSDSVNDVHTHQIPTEPTITSGSRKDTVPAEQTLMKPEGEKIPPAEQEDKSATNSDAKADTPPTNLKEEKAENNASISGHTKDKAPVKTADTKDQNGANKNVSSKLQEKKKDANESTKVPPSNKSPSSTTTVEKSVPVTNNSKSATPELGNGSFSPSASSLSGLGPLPHGTQKESVLMRLNNRIKTLEINMSLSGLYLEELSQRYRKQMDEMQKAFNTKIKSVQENSQKAQEARQQQAEYIQQLERRLEKMTTDLENVTLRMDGMLREVVERHLFLMLCEVMIMVILFTYCLRRSTSQSSQRVNTPVTVTTAKSSGKKPVEDVGRRNSDGLLHVPMRDKISLSPGLGNGLDFLKNSANSKTGSLDDLLIIGPTTPLREALRQASEPSKQKNRNKNKGRHKTGQRPASVASSDNIYQDIISSSSSTSSLSSTISLPSSSTTKGLPGTTSSKHSTAGLLFKGSAGVKKGLQGVQNKQGGGRGGGQQPSKGALESIGQWGQNKQGGGGKGGSNQPQRGAPENIGQVNGVYQGGKAQGGGVNGYGSTGSGGGGGGKKNNNQCFNGYGKR